MTVKELKAALNKLGLDDNDLVRIDHPTDWDYTASLDSLYTSPGRLYLVAKFESSFDKKPSTDIVRGNIEVTREKVGGTQITTMTRLPNEP